MKSKLIYVTVLVALLAVTIPAVSQQPAPMLVYVQRIQVKADRVADFLELAKQGIEPIKKAAPTDLVRLVCRTVVGNANEFWMFGAMNKFADRDGENPMNKFSTPQERAARNARLGQMVERSQSSIESVVGDLLVAPKGGNNLPAFIRYSRVRVRPGAANDFISIQKSDIIPVLKKINGNTRVHRIAYGGNLNEFAIYNTFAKWAELDDNTAWLNAVGGEAAARKLQDKLTALVVNNERYILQVLPDLSYMPAPAAAPKR